MRGFIKKAVTILAAVACTFAVTAPIANAAPYGTWGPTRWYANGYRYILPYADLKNPGYNQFMTAYGTMFDFCNTNLYSSHLVEVYRSSTAMLANQIGMVGEIQSYDQAGRFWNFYQPDTIRARFLPYAGANRSQWSFNHPEQYPGYFTDGFFPNTSDSANHIADAITSVQDNSYYVSSYAQDRNPFHCHGCCP